MNKCIDTNELLGKLPYPADAEEAEFYEKVIDAIEECPTADAVEVVHGEWIRTGVIAYRCSECNYLPMEAGTAFCPNCGAKMDGKKVE